MVDKNLFLYDLAVVAILKNEGAYLKEWLDYHLLAGVDHFYLYDNDSPDNQREVAAPYVEAGLVDYFHIHGEGLQHVAYNDAVKNFKFHCRYMAFIDGDEFIFPKTNLSIVETLDEILSLAPEAAGVAINWQIFGSNGHRTADYSVGVLERFTRRAQSNFDGNLFLKTISNPRKINFSNDPHMMQYFEALYAINENGKTCLTYINNPVTADKIVVNHYYIKSYEEFLIKINRGWVNGGQSRYNKEMFEINDRNEVFDDGILRYRAARAQNFSLETDAQRFNRVSKALTETLTSFSSEPDEFFVGKTETALTCRALSAYLREKFPDNADYWNLCEETSLAATLKSLDAPTIIDVRIFIRELPKILRLNYPVVDELRAAALNMAEKLKTVMRLHNAWKNFVELDYLQDLLKE